MALPVAFLWHMHQPSYVDPARRVALMSWVRLHATKGYLDMIWLAQQVPEFRCTFNLTPVLVRQIRELADNQVRDLWLELAAAPAESLTHAQRCAILEHFFKANWDNMVKPYPRYWQLLQQRGLTLNRAELGRVARQFNDQDYRDLQVWFHLTWFGYAAETLYPEILEWKRRGRNFTEPDKKLVLDRQRDVLGRCLDLYREAAARGQVELSTTPFYHPILPLVYNTEFARRCMPGRHLPPPFSHPEDVRAQLTMARAAHTEVFGRPPHGVWPSEGSVCPELIPILQELGFEWMATDEEVLWRSLHHQQHDVRLFQGFQLQHGNAGIRAAFRDRTASDFIGFSASRNPPEQAARFVIDHLKDVARSAPEPGALCPVILDGENAWEHFRDGGQQFLRELYRQLTSSPELQTVTFHDHFQAHPPKTTITTLHTGSWINADFDIWIGDPEENRAWELLGQTRDFLQDKARRNELSPDQVARAMDDVYAAEGSDWFWWYGGDFVTENDLIFDELFRSHLQNVYRTVGAAVPEALKNPIRRRELRLEVRPPLGIIHPQIDGQVTSFYEWIEAGHYEAAQAMVTMYRSERLVDAIYFGFDLENLYLRVDFRPKAELPPRLTLRIQFGQPLNRAIVAPELRRGSIRPQLWDTSSQPGPAMIGDAITGRFEAVLEMAVGFGQLGCKPRDVVTFGLQVFDGELEIERHPEVGALTFLVPDESFGIENWMV